MFSSKSSKKIVLGSVRQHEARRKLAPRADASQVGAIVFVHCAFKQQNHFKIVKFLHNRPS